MIFDIHIHLQKKCKNSANVYKYTNNFDFIYIVTFAEFLHSFYAKNIINIFYANVT
jgi:hypothetical protein